MARKMEGMIWITWNEGDVGKSERRMDAISITRETTRGVFINESRDEFGWSSRRAILVLQTRAAHILLSIGRATSSISSPSFHASDRNKESEELNKNQSCYILFFLPSDIPGLWPQSTSSLNNRRTAFSEEGTIHTLTDTCRCQNPRIVWYTSIDSSYFSWQWEWDVVVVKRWNN